MPEFIVEAFSYHKDSIQAVKVNRNNKNEILTGGLDNIFNLIRIDSGNNLFSKTYDETVAFVDWSNDGSKIIAGCLNNKIYVMKIMKKKNLLNYMFWKVLMRKSHLCRHIL